MQYIQISAKPWKCTLIKCVSGDVTCWCNVMAVLFFIFQTYYFPVISAFPEWQNNPAHMVCRGWFPVAAHYPPLSHSGKPPPPPPSDHSSGWRHRLLLHGRAHHLHHHVVVPFPGHGEGLSRRLLLGLLTLRTKTWRASCGHCNYFAPTSQSLYRRHHRGNEAQWPGQRVGGRKMPSPGWCCA